MRNKSFDIVAIGDCTLDHYIVPEKFSVTLQKGKRYLSLPYGDKIPVRDFLLFPGGNPLNTAVGFARLGLKAAIMSDLNDDSENLVILKKIKEEKVSQDLLKIGKTTGANKSIVIVTGGERTVLSHHSNRRYNFRNNFSSKWIYLTSLGTDYATIYQAVIKHKKRTGVKIVYNPGSMQLMNALPAVRKMVATTDLLFVNMQEASEIVGKKLQVKILLAKLYAMGARIVSVTDGKRGSYAYDGKTFYKISAFPGKRVDATGAGDAFASGFTSAIARGESVVEAMRWGSANAASEVGQIGVQNGLLTLTSMKKILAKNKSYQAKKQ